MTNEKILKNIVNIIRENFDDESAFIHLEGKYIIKLKDIYIDYSMGNLEDKVSYHLKEDEIDLAKDIISNKDKYVRLPKITELFHIYSVMDEFIQERLSYEEREDILNIISLGNRYKRFEEAIQGTDLEVLFEIFLHDKIEEEIKIWLQEREIKY